MGCLPIRRSRYDPSRDILLQTADRGVSCFGDQKPVPRRAGRALKILGNDTDPREIFGALVAENPDAAIENVFVSQNRLQFGVINRHETRQDAKTRACADRLALRDDRA